MQKTIVPALFLGALVMLSACQSDERVTSLNPALQSTEAQTLRKFINGATFGWASNDTKDRTGCMERMTYARDGRFSWETRCKTVTDPSRFLPQTKAGEYVYRGEGSWAVREGEQICFNIFRVNGAATDEASRDASCWAARPAEDRLILAIGGNTFAAMVISRS